MRLKQMAVCPFCPYELMEKDRAQIGKIYLVFPESISNGALICGGCRHITLLEIVMDATGKYLPLEVLEQVPFFPEGEKIQ